MRSFPRLNLRPVMMHPIARRGMTVAHWILAIAPISLLITGAGACLQATRILGKVPQPWINDPYLFGHNDAAYQAWLQAASLALGFTVLSLIPWFVLTAVAIFAHWRYWAKTESRGAVGYRFLPIGLYLLSWVVLIWEPVGLIDWLLD
ncbi:hypothetical protein [Limnothrix redekei]|uniref:Uncharacterized protein n=1 Tax=Limnothrix redekei LRLZ20PSL1 TaxID=3112953 RepID=A0ABW7C5W2_9CYAN